jgi:hypothetical protein
LSTPYKLIPQEDRTVCFLTRNGIEYQCAFIPDQNFEAVDGHQVYFFNLETRGNTSAPFDYRTQITICFLVNRFFENNVSAVLFYLCDNNDGRGWLRDEVFTRWYMTHNSGDKSLLSMDFKNDNFRTRLLYLNDFGLTEKLENRLREQLDTLEKQVELSTI